MRRGACQETRNTICESVPFQGKHIAVFWHVDADRSVTTRETDSLAQIYRLALGWAHPCVKREPDVIVLTSHFNERCGADSDLSYESI
uniref:Uncharacterized protein n=1 Tax=Anguilla anguilla TaxID=7936 RepID=A0A0E9RP09_ANGAN